LPDAVIDLCHWFGDSVETGIGVPKNGELGHGNQGWRACGQHTTPAGVTRSTTKVSAGDFRCDINGLEAESAKLNEHFRRTAGTLPHKAQ
jgi:hypothetical protein